MSNGDGYKKKKKTRALISVKKAFKSNPMAFKRAKALVHQLQWNARCQKKLPGRRIGFCTNPNIWVTDVTKGMKLIQKVKYWSTQADRYRGEEFYPDFAEALPVCRPIFDELREITPQASSMVRAGKIQKLANELGKYSKTADRVQLHMQATGFARKTRRVYEWVQIHEELYKAREYLHKVMLLLEYAQYHTFKSPKRVCNEIRLGWSSLVACGKGRAPCQLQPPLFQAASGKSLCKGDEMAQDKVERCNVCTSRAECKRRKGQKVPMWVLDTKTDVRRLTGMDGSFVKQVFMKAKKSNHPSRQFATARKKVTNEIARITQRINQQRSMLIGEFECQIHIEGSGLGYVCKKTTNLKVEVCKVLQTSLEMKPCAIPLKPNKMMLKSGFSQTGLYFRSMKLATPGSSSAQPIAKQVVCTRTDEQDQKMKCDVKKLSKCIGESCKDLTILHF